MPKRKRAVDDEKYDTPFRRYSQELHSHSKNCKRETPSMLITPDLGSPKKVWSLLCSKDEMNKRNWRAEQRHKDIESKHRCMIVDWLMEVSTSLKLHRETFHLAVDYFDRFLCISNNVDLSELQLIATSALAIAAKIEEIYPPKVIDIADFTDGGCSADKVVTMEKIILIKLDWNFNPVTAVHWLALYLQLIAKMNDTDPDSIVKKKVTTEFVNDDTDDGDSTFNDSFLRTLDGAYAAMNESINDSMLTMNCSYSDGHIYVDQSVCVPKLLRDDFVQLTKVIDLLILDPHFLKHKYSELAAAVLFCSYEPSQSIEEITGLKKQNLTELINIVQIFVDYCDERNAVSHETSVIEEINPDDTHNIQTFGGNNNETLTEIILRQKKKKQELALIHQTHKKQSHEVVLKEKNL